MFYFIFEIKMFGIWPLQQTAGNIHLPRYTPETSRRDCAEKINENIIHALIFNHKLRGVNASQKGMKAETTKAMNKCRKDSNKNNPYINVDTTKDSYNIYGE